MNIGYQDFTEWFANRPAKPSVYIDLQYEEDSTKLYRLYLVSSFIRDEHCHYVRIALGVIGAVNPLQQTKDERMVVAAALSALDAVRSWIKGTGTYVSVGAVDYDRSAVRTTSSCSLLRYKKEANQYLMLTAAEAHEQNMSALGRDSDILV